MLKGGVLKGVARRIRLSLISIYLTGGPIIIILKFSQIQFKNSLKYNSNKQFSAFVPKYKNLI